MSVFGTLFDKIKTMVGNVISVGEDEAHQIAAAAVPVVEHLRDEIDALVKTAVDEAKADILAALEELKASLPTGSTPPAE